MSRNNQPIYEISDDEDEVRRPDDIRRERLIGATGFNENEVGPEDDEFNRAIYESIRFHEFERIEEKNMNRIMKMFQDEKIQRQKIFDKLLTDLARLKRMDQDASFVLDIIEPIIDAYCEQQIEICELEIHTHQKVFKYLTRTRTDQSAVDKLSKIILPE